MIVEPAGEDRPDAVPRYARVDVIGGILLMTIALLVWVGAIELEFGSITDIQSGTLPTILAIALAIVGLGVVLQGLLQPPESSEGLELAIRPTALIILSIGVFGLFIRGGNFGLVSTPQLGLLVVGPLTVFISGCAADKLRVQSLVVLAFGLTSALLLIFVDVLAVNIPVYPKAIADFLNTSMGEYFALRAGYVVYAMIAVGLYITLYMSAERKRG